MDHVFRLGSHSAALAAFKRAISLCQELGCLNRAAEAALTLYQELWEQLAIKGAITTARRGCFVALIVVCGIGAFLSVLVITYLIWDILSIYFRMKSLG